MQEKKQHGNTGKRNALKGDVAKTAFIGFKIEPEKRTAYIKAANGKNLSTWITSVLDREVAKCK